MKEIISYITDNELLSVRAQCELVEVNRSTVYYEPVGESEENLTLMRLMDEHYLDHPTHGVLQMQDFLLMVGFCVNHKRVRRLLRLMGLMAIFPKRNLSKLGLAKYIRPYLLKGLEITRPNQVWAIDITYIPMAKGFMYLTAIIDLYSRYIIAWDVFNSLHAETTMRVLNQAIRQHGKPEMINSDQGAQFTCALWTEFSDNQGITLSMDGKGRATDNIFIERFWRTVKQDHVYLHPATDGSELYNGLKEFIHYYNYRKPHQGINRMIPFHLYQQVA
jgi:putative transposase